MILAIIGYRDCPPIDIMSQLKHLPTAIAFCGTDGVAADVREFAIKNNLPLTEYLPEYDKYGEKALLVRNRLIVDNADCVLAFWDGQSSETKYTIDYAKEQGKPLKVIYVNQDGLIPYTEICNANQMERVQRAADHDEELEKDEELFEIWSLLEKLDMYEKAGQKPSKPIDRNNVTLSDLKEIIEELDNPIEESPEIIEGFPQKDVFLFDCSGDDSSLNPAFW